MGRKVKPLYPSTERETAAYCLIRKIDFILEQCPSSCGVRSFTLKGVLNKLEKIRRAAKTVSTWNLTGAFGSFSRRRKKNFNSGPVPVGDSSPLHRRSVVFTPSGSGRIWR